MRLSAANAAANAVDDLTEFSTLPLEDVEGSYDVVLANILAPVLVSLADDLKRVLRPTGTLLISGVLDGGFDHVAAALAPLRIVRTDTLDGWAAVEFSW